MKICWRQQGVGLIEVMVAVVIGMLMLSGGVMYFNNFQQNQALAQARDEAVAIVKMARNYAVSRQSPTGFSGQLDYVAVVLSDNRIRLTAVDQGGDSRDYNTYNLEEEIELAASPAELWFSAYEGRLLKPEGASFVTRGVDELVEVELRLGSQSLNFRINSLGLIGGVDE